MAPHGAQRRRAPCPRAGSEEAPMEPDPAVRSGREVGAEDTGLMAEMAEEGGDCGLVLELLGCLGGYRTTVRDTLRDGQDETSRLEEVGGLERACLGHPQGGKTAPVLSTWRISGDNLPIFYFDLCS